jgi:nitronate monooxygenase
MYLSEVLGIDIPIIQAPMAGVQNWRLAAAVSNAGALGSIPCGMLGNDQIVQEIEAFRAASNAHYNLNFFCHAMPAFDQAVQDRWLQRLAPYYREWHLDPPAEIGALRRPFDEQIAEAIAAYKPPVLSFHFGLPEPSLVDAIKSWGGIILSSATTLDEGQWLQDNGADAVIAQGVEAGGHRAMFLTQDIATQSAMQPLLDGLLEKLSVPVIAAGGISNNAKVKSVLSSGAAAVQIGTSYLLCDEATSSQPHRIALQELGAETALTNVFSGRPARGICNRLMQELNGFCDDAPAFPYAAVALGPLRTAAEAAGSSDFTPLWAGIDRSGCREISAAALTRSLWSSGSG